MAKQSEDIPASETNVEGEYWKQKYYFLLETTEAEWKHRSGMVRQCDFIE